MKWSESQHGPHETIFQNGAQEFWEETQVILKRLILVKNIYFDEQYAKTRYMIAVCLSPTPDEPGYKKNREDLNARTEKMIIQSLKPDG